MLKHLYKTLLISVISGSLLSFSPAIALAADGQSQTTTDSNGVITAKKNYKFEKISDADMLASITMLAGGYVAGRMLRVYRPITLDVGIAATGGAAFVAGEVLTNVKFKGKIDAMTVEVEKRNDQTVNEDQIKQLQELKTSYEEAKKTTGYKKMLQQASAAAFAAAGVAATYLWYTEDTAITECTTAMTTMAAGLEACAKNASNTEGAAHCVLCEGELKTYQSAFTKYLVTRVTPKLSVKSSKAAAKSQALLSKPMCASNLGVEVQALSRAPSGICVSSMGVLIANQTQSHDLSVSSSDKNFKMLKNYLNIPTYTNLSLPKKESSLFGYLSFLKAGLNLFFPKAQASWLPLLGLGVATSIAFFAITGSFLTEADFLMFVPINRAAIWAVFAGLALLASNSSENVMKKLDANITKIDSILADLNKLSLGVKAQNLSHQGITISTTNPVLTAGISFSTDATLKSECMTNNNSTNCPPLANKLSSMPGFANLPDSFKDIASQSVALGDALSGANGISGSALSSAESLGGKANALANLLKARLVAVKNNSNGKIDLNKNAKNFQAGLGAKIKKTLAAKGMTATGFMASIGSTPIDSSLANKEITPESGKKISASQNAINIQDGAGNDNGAQSLKLDFNEVTPGEGLSMGQVSSDAPAKEYDMNTPEINGEFGPSLFELISGRYLKSGYPKLLEEEPSKN
jgi:hypothetical protein